MHSTNELWEKTEELLADISVFIRATSYFNDLYICNQTYDGIENSRELGAVLYTINNYGNHISEQITSFLQNHYDKSHA